MAEEHTPGPWSFDAICFDHRIAIRGGVTAHGRPYHVALVNRPGSAYAGQDKANARLIAAAPELLGAGLPIAAEIALYGPSAGEDDDELVGIRLADLKALRAAIAKATGQ